MVQMTTFFLFLKKHLQLFILNCIGYFTIILVNPSFQILEFNPMLKFVVFFNDIIMAPHYMWPAQTVVPIFLIMIFPLLISTPIAIIINRYVPISSILKKWYK